MVSEQSAMWWWPIRFYCHPQSPGLGIWGFGDWGLGTGDRGLTIAKVSTFRDNVDIMLKKIFLKKVDQ